MWKNRDIVGNAGEGGTKHEVSVRDKLLFAMSHSGRVTKDRSRREGRKRFTKKRIFTHCTMRFHDFLFSVPSLRERLSTATHLNLRVSFPTCSSGRKNLFRFSGVSRVSEGFSPLSGGDLRSARMLHTTDTRLRQKRALGFRIAAGTRGYQVSFAEAYCVSENRISSS